MLYSNKIEKSAWMGVTNMSNKKVLAIIMVSVMALGSTSCKARERYLTEYEEVYSTTPVLSELEYGSLELPHGWEETGPGSYELIGDDEYYSYYLTVSHDTNDYVGDDRYMFPNDNDEPIHQEFPDADIYVLMEGGCNDDAAATYLIENGDTYIVRWYRVRAGDQVLFELTTPDAGVQDSEVMSELDQAVIRFDWN